MLCWSSFHWGLFCSSHSWSQSSDAFLLLVQCSECTCTEVCHRSLRFWFEVSMWIDAWAGGSGILERPAPLFKRMFAMPSDYLNLLLWAKDIAVSLSCSYLLIFPSQFIALSLYSLNSLLWCRKDARQKSPNFFLARQLTIFYFNCSFRFIVS